MEPWILKITDPSLGGYVPLYFTETYPSYGDKNQAGSMQSMDLTNPGFMSQGPGIGTAVNGTSATVSTTIAKILDTEHETRLSYAVGGDKLYRISANAAYTNVAATTGTVGIAWPHTISAAAATIAEGTGLAEFGGNYYYAYNYSTVSANVGKYDGSSTVNDTWWTGTLGAGKLVGKMSGDIVHPIEVGGNGTMYIGNQQYVASYDGTTAVVQALDLPSGYTVESMKWINDRLVIAARHSPSGLYSIPATRSSIYIWDGTTDSWETEIPVRGDVGGSHVVNGTYYQFYFDRFNSYTLAKLEGTRLVDITSFDGGLPRFGQVTDYKGFLAWVDGSTGGNIYMYGSGEQGLPARLFKFAKHPNGTVFGGLSSAFGRLGLLTASNNGLKFTTGYATSAAYWKSVLFHIGGSNPSGGKVDGIRFDFEQLTSGARMDWSLKDNQGKTIYSDAISYLKATATEPTHTLTSAYYPLNGKVTENMRLELDFTQGSSSAPVKLKRTIIYGRS